MKQRFIRFLFSFTLLLGMGLQACSPETPIPAEDWSRFAEQLNAETPRLMRQYRVPGAAVALVHGGRVVWTKGFGLANEGSGAAIDEQTVFQAASISKSLTAWGILRLVEKGQLDLDAPAERYLTRWHLPPSAFDSQKVTLRRLLAHSAGLSIGGYAGLPPEQPLPALEASLTGSIQHPQGVRLVQEPGSYSYSGGGYTLLQLIIEEVSGEPFSAFMQREVLDALHMQHSSFEWRADLRPATATGYDSGGQALPNYLFTEKAAAGLYTTATDLALFASAEMPGPDGQPAGRGVLSPQSINLLHSPTSQPGGLDGWFGDSYGLGHTVETLPNGLVVTGHTGSNRGWRSMYLEIPQRGAGLVVLTNSNRGSDLTLDLSQRWSQWAGTGTLKSAQAFGVLRAGLAGLAALLGATLLFDLARTAWQLWIGRRVWRWPLSSQTLPERLRLGLKVGLLAILAVLLLIGLHPLLAEIAFLQAPWLTLGLELWCLWGILKAFTRRENGSSPLKPRHSPA